MHYSFVVALFASLCMLRYAGASPLVEKRDSLSAFITANYNLVGCYVGTSNIRPLNGAEVVYDTDSIMDHDKCATACSPFRFFGIFRGIACACGDEILSTAQDAAGQCTSDCSGFGASTPTGSCGGPNTNGLTLSIFEKKNPSAVLPLPPSVTTSYHIGCFVEFAAWVNYRVPGALSVERCQVVCKGYRFYGLAIRNSIGSCLCHNQIGIPQVGQPSCNQRCGNDGTQFCGGSNYRSVFTSSSACANVDQQLNPNVQTIMKNPSFESGTSYWSIVSTSNQITWATRKDTTAVQGSYLARIDSKTPGLSMALVQPIKLCQGLTYEMSYDAKQDVDAGCRTTPGLTEPNQFPSFTEGSSWKNNKVQFYAPDELVDFKLTVKCDGAGKGGLRKVYLDNIKMYRFLV